MVGVKLKGASKFQRLVSRWKKAVPENVVRAFQQAGTILEGEAKRRAPVGTAAARRGEGGRLLKSTRGGQLKQSITHAVERPTRGMIVGVYGTNVKYAMFPEFGTRNIQVGTPRNPRTSWAALRARGGRGRQTMPYLRSAFYVMRGRVDNLIARALKPPR